MDPVTSAHQNQHLHEMIKSQQAHIENLTRMLDIALRKLQETPKIVQVAPQKSNKSSNAKSQGNRSSDDDSDSSDDSEEEERNRRKRNTKKHGAKNNTRMVKPPSLFF